MLWYGSAPSLPSLIPYAPSVGIVDHKFVGQTQMIVKNKTKPKIDHITHRERRNNGNQVFIKLNDYCKGCLFSFIRRINV